MTKPVSDRDLEELKLAKRLLENPGIAAKLTNFIGGPIEKGFALLPKGWHDNLGEMTRTALLKAADAAIFTLKDRPGEMSSDAWHKLAAAVSGGVGGFFGIGALAVELPLSTTIMLRSIADVARSQGESLAAADTKLACLEVFALGGPGRSDDGSESGYYAVRAALAKSVTDAANFIASKALVDDGAPVLIKLIAQIAQRFGVQVTEKAAAQAVPAIGAVGGALVNSLFIDHFQDMARGHFIVRKLERKYGRDCIEKRYAEL